MTFQLLPYKMVLLEFYSKLVFNIYSGIIEGKTVIGRQESKKYHRFKSRAYEDCQHRCK